MPNRANARGEMEAQSKYAVSEEGMKRIEELLGQTYYAKRLQEAIEGQAKARELIDARGVDSYFE